MSVYYFELFGAVILSIFAVIFGKRDESNKIILNKYFVFFLILFLASISGFREILVNNIGRNTDEYRLRVVFDSLIGSGFDFSRIKLLSEPGNYILFWVLANTVKNSQWFVLIYALITNLLIIKSFEKYTKNYFPMAIFLYITSGFFLSSWNLIYQFLAAAIIFSGFRFVLSRDFKKYFMIVFVASLFHSSAWLMLPIYFVATKKMKNLHLVIVIILVVASIPIFEQLLRVVVSNTMYSYYLSDIESREEGVNILRVFAWILPYFLILLNKDKIIMRDKNNNAFLYQVILSGIVMIFSIFYLYFYRLNVYFGLYSIVLVSQIPLLVNKSIRPLFIFLMGVLFFAFGFYQHLVAHEYFNILFSLW